MSLVMRGTRPYLYRSVRRNGRVTSVYGGSGAVAELAAQIDSIRRQSDRERRAAEKAERARIAAEDAPAIELFRAVETTAREALLASGYYLHRRSEWRRRGSMTTEVKATESGDVTFDLLKRARDGDPSTRKEIRAFLERDGDLFAEFEMGHLTDVKLSRLGRDDNVIVQEVSLRELRRTAEELAGPNPTPLERMLAHRVAVCQLSVHHAEYRLASQSGKEVTLNYMEYLERRVDSAHRRLLQAAKMLATVRKLGVASPAVQVQVNQVVNVDPATTAVPAQAKVHQIDAEALPETRQN
jgi:hypothetical protein